jgi:hypothetical protein
MYITFIVLGVGRVTAASLCGRVVFCPVVWCSRFAAVRVRRAVVASAVHTCGQFCGHFVVSFCGLVLWSFCGLIVVS